LSVNAAGNRGTSLGCLSRTIVNRKYPVIASQIACTTKSARGSSQIRKIGKRSARKGKRCLLALVPVALRLDVDPIIDKRCPYTVR
jgi:hypothetical protein